MIVKNGLDVLLARRPGWIKETRLGLVANQASVTADYTHAATALDLAFPYAVTALFGPQHGFLGEKQDNMKESSHGRDEKGRPIHSLYGQVRRPTPGMLGGLDALLIDLTDVGTRVYTFASTMVYCLEAAAGAGLKVVVLDRPNPIGGMAMEGGLLEADAQSFVGLLPIPMRHGLTMGELALLARQWLQLDLELEIVRAEGWRRDMVFAQTGLPWVMPSPNMPTPETALLYPGQVIWEGTNLSEGRGTTRPFHLVGAPFIQAQALARQMNAHGLPGAVFRPASFEPCFNKHAGALCQGLEIHVTDPVTYQPYLTSLTILELVLKLWGAHFQFTPPPYEYEFERLPFDLITGGQTVRQRLLAGETARELSRSWRGELAEFERTRREFLLY